MPQKTAPYFVCTRTGSRFYGTEFGKNEGFHWNEATSAELDDAQESTILLLKNVIGKHSFLTQILDPIINKQQISKPSKFSFSLKRRIIRLDIEQLKALDALELDWCTKAALVSEIVHQIYHYLRESKVAINFREYFFIEKGQALPSHYRKDIDLCCETLEEYKNQTSKTSYQLIKKLFSSTTRKRSEDKQESLLDSFIREHYATRNAPSTRTDYFIGYKKPLNELPYHNTILEAHINLSDVMTFKYPPSITLMFSPCISSINELESLFDQHLLVSEFTIILHNSKYSLLEERQKIHEQALLLASKIRIPQILNIIFLTTKELHYNLQSLAPISSINLQDTFSPLAQNTGYYLSSSKLFSLILSRKRNSYTYLRHCIKEYLHSHPIEQSTYIYGQQKTEACRKTKSLNREALALIGNSTLTITHQQQLGQVQEVNQIQEISQTQQLNQQVDTTHSFDYSQRTRFSWLWSFDFTSFCNALQKAAILELLKETTAERLVKKTYFTRRYYDSAGADYCLRQIVDNQQFRMRFAAKFFSLAYVEKNNQSEVIQLPHESVDEVADPYVGILIGDLEFYTKFRDGINPAQRTLGPIFFPYYVRVLNGDNTPSKHYGYINELCKQAATSQLELLYPNYVAYSQYPILLSEADLSQIPRDQKELLIGYANNLLKLFKKIEGNDPQFVLKQEKELFELIKFYFPNEPAYITILNTLFHLFEEHNDDNLRIIIQIIISGYREKLEHFLNFLIQLNSRGALKHFYKIYFKYAKDILSVDQLLNDIPFALFYPTSYYNRQLFINLFIHTPVVSSHYEWPLFEKFAYHVLLFAAKNNHYDLEKYNYIELKQFWQQLSLKFLAYTNQDIAQCQELLKTLVASLICEEKGLTLAPLNTRETLFDVLEQLIDHAIYNNTLKEQLEEMESLSFLWTDVPYAIKYNQFLVVCSEMQLYGQEVNPKTKKYSISLNELAEAINTHSPKNHSLKTALFRFLGQEPQRHKLSFYRALHTALHKQDYDPKIYIKELLFGYYIKNFTGINYQRPFEEKQISEEFALFLQGIPATKEIEQLLITQAIAEFFLEYNKIYNSKTLEQTTLLALWQEQGCSPLINKLKQIPKILIQQFTIIELQAFLIRNTKTLQDCLPSLSQSPELSYGIIHYWFDKQPKANFNRTSLSLLRHLYPQFTLTVFLQNLPKVNRFIEAYKLLTYYGARGNIYIALEHLAKQHKKIELLIELIELLVKELGQNNTHRKRDLLGAKFLAELSQKSGLLNNIDNLKPLLSLALSHYLNSTIKNESASLLLQLVSKVQPLKENAQPVLKQLLTFMADPQIYLFFIQQQKLNAKQLESISQLFKKIGDNNLAVSLMQLCLRKQEDFNFNEAVKFLRFVPQEQAKAMVTLCTVINTPTEFTSYMKQLIKLAPNNLQKLVNLHKSYDLTKEDLLTLLESPSIPEAINEFEHIQNIKKLERFEYDKAELSKKIAQIKIKKPTGEIVALNEQQQKQMSKDYERLMSYMVQKIVLREQDGQEKSKDFSIHELNSEQCALLLQRLNHLVAQGKQTHDHRLMKLALCCETLYRTTKKFPRTTQIITLLNSLRQPDHIIHEVQTGEGKSIIAALHAALLYNGKRSIDIVTENNHLAQEGLDKFKSFYTYLEIPYASVIIEAQTPFYNYAAPGINYSTASNLALFRNRAALDSYKLTTDVDLLCDEIDATLTTLVQYRLASGNDALLNNNDSWALIYTAMLAFVKEKELFSNNHCDAKEDVLNFIHYFKLKNPKTELIKFIDQVDKELLNEALDSALTALELEENIDFMVVCNASSSYAAPIIKETKRPNIQVNYSKSLQQLIHTRLNNKKPPPRYNFPITPVSKTIMVITAKNFFDFYRLNGGRLIGLTGTAGTEIELLEFYQQQGLITYNYPTFHESKCVDLGLFTAMNTEEHLKLLLTKIAQHKEENPSQPILIITASPQETLGINDYLTNHSLWNIQIYNGYDATGFAESEIITKAGQGNIITIANESLARGADITPSHPQGLWVINVTTDVTASALRQIKGRAARNGQEGKFCSIINAKTIAHAEMSIEEMSAAFLTHQQQLSIQAQKQRARTRLLEEVRYHLVNKCLLEVQQQATTILKRQFGAHYALLNMQDLTATLSIFNENIESHYTQLLEKHGTINDAGAQEFIASCINRYQNILNSWLPEKKFDCIHLIEPLVPLEHLKALKVLHLVKIEQLALVSRFSSKIWMHQGHEKMQSNLSYTDKIVRILDPYSKNKCSLKYALADGALNEELVMLNDVVDIFTHLEKEAGEFIRLLIEIPILGSFVPKDVLTNFVTQYLAKTKQQIKEKKWDDIDLPDIGLSTILNWVARLNYIKNLASSAAAVGSVLAGGPAGFLVNRFVIPTLISWLTALFKKMFSGSESEYIQVIMGLTNISSDLSNAVFALSKLSKPEQITVGVFLDNFAPLFKNKALINLIIKYLELSKQMHLAPYIELIPEFLEALEPYRTCKIKEVFSVATLVDVLHKACQFEQIKKYVEHTEFNVLLDNLHLLTPEFLQALGQLNFEELANLVKVLAHPEFFNFVSKLPAKASYNDLITWLDSKIETAPPEVKEVLNKLITYQTNGERIAEDSKISLHQLRLRFSLSVDKLASELAKLTPLHPNATITVLPEPETIPWKLYLGITTTFISLIVYNIFFFSISALLTSSLVVGVLLYPYVQEQISSWLSAEIKLEPEAAESPKLADPIVVVAAQHSATKQLTLQDKLDIRTLSRKYGFFKKETDAAKPYADHSLIDYLPKG